MVRSGTALTATGHLSMLEKSTFHIEMRICGGGPPLFWGAGPMLGAVNEAVKCSSVANPPICYGKIEAKKYRKTANF